MTTAAHLHTVIHHWDDLTDSLGTPNTTSWPPAGLRAHLNALEGLDAAEAEAAQWRAAAQRADERRPDQIGERPVPIRVAVYDAMRDIEDTLRHCATITAAEIQRQPMERAPSNWPATDRLRRDQLAREDAQDPRRWRFTGIPATAPQAAAWLLARLHDAPGPFRRLTDNQRARVATAAEKAAQTVERALDMARQERGLSEPCPHCRGRLVVEGGDGEDPAVKCTQCDRTWREQETAA